MSIDIIEGGPECLAEYEQVPISFQVESILRLVEEAGGLGGLRLQEEPVAEPYLRDYDAEGEELPTCWPERFDLSNWVFLLARDGDRLAGAATVLCHSPEVFMLDGRTDLSCLWDIRVHPEYRRQGVGRALFTHAAQWSRGRGCRQMKIETQNINVCACRFYRAMGCHLGAINRYFYREPEYAHEVALFWYREVG